MPCRCGTCRGGAYGWGQRLSAAIAAAAEFGAVGFTAGCLGTAAVNSAFGGGGSGGGVMLEAGSPAQQQQVRRDIALRMVLLS